MNATATQLTPYNPNSGGQDIDNLIHDMFEHISDKANGLSSPASRHESKPDGKTVAYVCIHLSPRCFVKLLAEAIPHVVDTTTLPTYTESPRNIKFLDVGCGVGQKVYMAERLFSSEHRFNVEGYGMELRPHHVKIARQTLSTYLQPTGRRYNSGFQKSRIIQGNAITFKRYSEFDIIYFYCPSPHVPTEIELEQAIAKGAKVGAVVVGVLSRYFSGGIRDELGIPYEKEWKKLGWKRIGQEMWKRVSLGA